MLLKIIVLFATILLLTNINICGQAKSWSKLIPLESTREEVEKILGKPESHFETNGLYETKFGRFSVWYSTGKCQKDVEGRQYNVPFGKMTGLIVTLYKFEPLGNYISNKKEFIKDKETNRFGRYFYESYDESLLYEVILFNKESEKVISISIQPSKDKKHLLCKQNINSVN